MGNWEKECNTDKEIRNCSKQIPKTFVVNFVFIIVVVLFNDFLFCYCDCFNLFEPRLSYYSCWILFVLLIGVLLCWVSDSNSTLSNKRMYLLHVYIVLYDFEWHLWVVLNLCWYSKVWPTIEVCEQLPKDHRFICMLRLCFSIKYMFRVATLFTLEFKVFQGLFEDFWRTSVSSNFQGPYTTGLNRL